MTRREAFAVRAMHYAGWLSGETKGRCKSQETFRNMMEWYDRFPEPALSAPAPQGIGREEHLSAGERAFTAWESTSRADGTPLMWTWAEMPESQRERWARVAAAVLPTEPPAQGEG